MTGRKRRKRRAHGVRGAAAARSMARQNSAALASTVRRSPDRQQSTDQLPSGDDTATPRLLRPQREGATMAATPGPTFRQPGLLGRVPTLLLPGRVFFAIGRPRRGSSAASCKRACWGGCRPHSGRFAPNVIWPPSSVGSRRAYGRSEGVRLLRALAARLVAGPVPDLPTV